MVGYKKLLYVMKIDVYSAFEYLKMIIYLYCIIT